MIFPTLEPSLILPPPRLNCLSRSELLAYFERHWQLEEILFRQLFSAETFYLRPDPLRNPLIFYLGHSAVFYINKLIRVGLLNSRINPSYEQLFEIGVDPANATELEQATRSMQWPEVESVWQYRSQVREVVTEVIQATALNLPIDFSHPLWALLMAIEHSCIHFETSSMLVRQLPLSQLNVSESWPYADSSLPTANNRFIQVPGGTVHLGKSAQDFTYGWDSDYGDRLVTVQPFLCSQYLITNQEFLDFVEAGGYENPDYWQPDAWQSKQENQVKHPKFWRLDAQGNCRYRALFTEMDLPLAWPVEVNHYEAQAFCQWQGKGTRLLSEAEWQQALNFQHQNELNEPNYNLYFQWGSPSAVGSLETSDNPDYLYDLRGNVWQWTQDIFNPLPGFKPHYLYDNYSAPFFDDNHYLMLGGSWASTGCYASAQCRNWFRPYFYQHAGFRIARCLD